MRKALGLVGSLGGLGLFLLTYANRISNLLGFVSLPGEVKDALVLLSNIPTAIAWGGLSICLFCAAYLIL